MVASDVPSTPADLMASLETEALRFEEQAVSLRRPQRHRAFRQTRRLGP